MEDIVRNRKRWDTSIPIASERRGASVQDILYHAGVSCTAIMHWQLMARSILHFRPAKVLSRRNLESFKAM
jgi:hypothetical protein